MRGVKRPQKDDSVCLLIARGSTGQVSRTGSEVTGLPRRLWVDGKVEHTPCVTADRRGEFLCLPRSPTSAFHQQSEPSGGL